MILGQSLVGKYVRPFLPLGGPGKVCSESKCPFHSSVISNLLLVEEDGDCDERYLIYFFLLPKLLFVIIKNDLKKKDFVHSDVS